MTPREALDRIAALCNDADETNGGLRGWVLAGRVRAVLAEVSPEPGGVLDRDQARKVLDLWSGGRIQYGEGLLDRLAGCVRPAAIDRDALKQLAWELNAMMDSLEEDTPRDAIYEQIRQRWQEVQSILALVRPVAGVTLTPEEAARVAHWYYADPMFHDAANEAIVARLEAAS